MDFDDFNNFSILMFEYFASLGWLMWLAIFLALLAGAHSLTALGAISWGRMRRAGIPHGVLHVAIGTVLLLFVVEIGDVVLQILELPNMPIWINLAFPFAVILFVGALVWIQIKDRETTSFRTFAAVFLTPLFGPTVIAGWGGIQKFLLAAT